MVTGFECCCSILVRALISFKSYCAFLFEVSRAGLETPVNLCDGVLCDNSYCWHCILISNDITHIVSSYEFLVFCISSLLVPSRVRWFQLIPGSSSSFQVVPAWPSFQYVRNQWHLTIFNELLLKNQKWLLNIFVKLKFPKKAVEHHGNTSTGNLQ